MAIYHGFSTLVRRKRFHLTDFELAKQDLLNHLHIRKGEKLMNPDFGTIIWNMLFEPLTPEVKAIIANDLTRIVNYDPRLAIEELTIAEFQNGIQVQLVLRFLTTNQVDTMRVTFDQASVN